jgi:hypothetical protein
MNQSTRYEIGAEVRCQDEDLGLAAGPCTSADWTGW